MDQKGTRIGDKNEWFSGYSEIQDQNGEARYGHKQRRESHFIKLFF